MVYVVLFTTIPSHYKMSVTWHRIMKR